MNRKQLTILIVAGVVICGLGLFFLKSNRQSWEAAGQALGQKVIKDFPMNDVDRITIKQPRGEIHLGRKNETWTLQERGDYPANFSTISEFLRKVWELKVAQPVKVGPTQLARLELSPPDKGTNGSTWVEFKDKNGKVISSLSLGKKHMKESPGGEASPFGGGGYPDGRYVMVGTDAKTVGVVSEPFSNIEAKPEEWLNKDFFKVEKLRSISVTTAQATNNWKVSRETETGEWKLADAKAGEQLDSAKSSAVTSALSSPSFNDVATNTAPEHTGLNKPLVAKLETFDGFQYEVSLGSKTSEDNYHLKMAVTGAFPKERTPGKDEKPEDKAKLDKEFQEKTKQLEEKLKAEKEYEKWVYLVPRYSVDALLKERRELLAEKKEEAKSEQTLVPPTSVVSPPVQVPLAPPAEPKETPPAPPAPPVSVVSPPVKAPSAPPAEEKKETPKPATAPPAAKAPSAPPPVPPAAPPAPAPAPKKSEDK